MFKLAIKVVGMDKLLFRLKVSKKRLKNLGPMYKAVGLELQRHYIHNMTQGVDPHGKALEPVQRWTRRHRYGVGGGAAKGKRPLIATGSMRNSLGLVELSNKHMRLGFRGKYDARAKAMINGTSGDMPVKRSSIRRTGLRGYIAVTDNAGNHFTKRVRGGHVRITPAKRDFFYLTGKQVRLAKRTGNRWLRKNIFK